MTLEKTEERKRRECRGDWEREREGGWNVPEKEGEERVHSATKREEREGDSEGLRKIDVQFFAF